MAQINKGTTYTDTGVGADVTATNLNAHVASATLLNGAVLDQTEKTVPVAADFVLLGDSTLAASGIPKKVTLTNLLPETIRQGVPQYVATDTGSANAYLVALSPAATAYTAGMVVRFKAGNANTTASTINVNSLGVKNIFTRAVAALAANDILANQIVELVYDGTQFQHTNAISAQEITPTHLIESVRREGHQYAADTGTANNYAVSLTPSPAAYTTGMVVRFKALNANTGASVITVNFLSAQSIYRANSSNVELAANDIRFNEIVELVYNGTFFEIDHWRSWDHVEAIATVPSSSLVLNSAHSLNFTPSRFEAFLVCITTDLGYAVGDRVKLNTSTVGWAISANATNVTVAQLNSATPSIVPKTGGAPAAIVAARWNFIVYASV